ncbi:MAG: hypothetical protein K6T83_08755 [Alicyclobacillus sp.]|nr:hypothetical protein [Alicyclobacillus sp.]
MSQTDLNDQNQSQLKVLGHILQTLSVHNINVWLRGGWAIDFLLGQITRPHEDIDLVTRVQHREKIEQTLVQEEFSIVPVSEFQTNFYKDAIEISFVFLSSTGDGHIYANGIPEWVWRSDALPRQLFTLHGVSSFVLSRHQLLENLLVYEQGTGRKLRPKDFQSINTLRNIIESST